MGNRPYVKVGSHWLVLLTYKLVLSLSYLYLAHALVWTNKMNKRGNTAKNEEFWEKGDF